MYLIAHSFVEFRSSKWFLLIPSTSADSNFVSGIPVAPDDAESVRPRIIFSRTVSTLGRSQQESASLLWPCSRTSSRRIEPGSPTCTLSLRESQQWGNFTCRCWPTIVGRRRHKGTLGMGRNAVPGSLSSKHKLSGTAFCRAGIGGFQSI